MNDFKELVASDLEYIDRNTSPSNKLPGVYGLRFLVRTDEGLVADAEFWHAEQERQAVVLISNGESLSDLAKRAVELSESFDRMAQWADFGTTATIIVSGYTDDDLVIDGYETSFAFGTQDWQAFYVWRDAA